jgi:HEAT repeat protein
MKPRRALFFLLAAAFPALPAAAAEQPARLANARLESRQAAGGLERTFRALAAAQESPAWVAWSVPTPGVHQMCCYGSLDDLESGPCAGRCFLEREDRNVTIVNSDGGDCVDRSGSSRMLVLVRLEARAPERLRTFSSDCTVDAGGLPVFWLSEVRPSESVALLQTFVGDSSLARKKRWKGGEPALSAIALHDDPSADTVLEKLAAPGNAESLRKQAFFWLGSARDRRGYDILRSLARTEESEEMRRHLTFAFSRSKVPDATETLLEMAKRDASPSVRGQALFWLAQKAGKKAASAIQNAIRNDPETEVKTRAVFALTQMPKDEGIPLLIEVARTSRNPEVRKKAVFWLGQSKDPRALAFIEEVLSRP